MAIATQSRANLTYEEFLRTYEDTFAEWEGGVVVPMSPVTFSHQDLSSFLLALFRSYLEENGTGKALAAPFQMRLRQVERGREPDIMVVLAENAGRINSTFLDGPAALIVEIVSPESVIEGFWIEMSWLWQRPLPTLRRIWNAWEEQAA